jgi:glycosyltransferase involved in cell wall biosynthesis
MRALLSTLVLNDGDAIGNDLLGMASALEDRGVEVTLFAEKTRIARHVESLSSLPAQFRNSDSILIHHHSLQCDEALNAIRHDPRRAIVKYHNVTPARYFVEADAEMIQMTEQGEQQARLAARSGATMWVDSDFNGRELGQGRNEYHVLPPFHEADKLVELPPDADSIAGLDDWGTTLLCVGRVAPNKNLELAIETLAQVRRHTDANARLILAGEHLFPSYSQKLRDLAQRLSVAEATLVTGRVSSAQLKALYRTADVLLVTSHHEGFCVPLVEAMALEVPIVAVPRAAIPETAGDAALFVETAEEMANCVHQLVQDFKMREELLVRAGVRYRQRFSTVALRSQFWDRLGEQTAFAGFSSQKNTKYNLYPTSIVS